MLQPFSVDRYLRHSWQWPSRRTYTVTTILTTDRARRTWHSCFSTLSLSITCNIKTITSAALYVHKYVTYGREWIVCVRHTNSGWYALGDGLRLHAFSIPNPPADASTLHPSLRRPTSRTMCPIPLCGAVPQRFLSVRFPWPPLMSLSALDVSSPYCTATGSSLVPAFFSLRTSATHQVHLKANTSRNSLLY